MKEHAVVIAGGGPTGMMLAAELTLANVDVAIVERRASADLEGSRAGGLHARTIETLDQRGVAERFISEGTKYPEGTHFHIALNLSDFPTRHNYTLGLWQKHIERILAGWIDELKIQIYREKEVTGFAQDDTGVDVEISDGSSLRAAYLVGCDGGRSVIRKKAGIDFPGWDATTSWIIAEAEMSEEPQWGWKHDAFGSHAIGKGDEGRARMVLTERQVGPASEPALSDVREALIAIYGKDFGIHNPKWISRFSDMSRQAAGYRERRVLLAGDAAHIHAPMGGQGLNLGVQDAVNLGWKLAQVIKRISPESLLDTYQSERYPIGARVLKSTMAQSAIRRPDDHTKALGDYLAQFLKMEEPRKRMAGEMSALDIHYDIGAGDPKERHPLVGRRMPDLDLLTDKGPVRVFALMHKARPVLINLGDPESIDIVRWADRVQRADARYEGKWELPVIGAVSAPSAVLVRPDGYVAWVGDRTQPALTEALTTWFGPPTAA